MYHIGDYFPCRCLEIEQFVFKTSHTFTPTTPEKPMRTTGLKCFVCVLLSLAAIWLMSLTSLIAQERKEGSSEGKEFWITFQKNFRDYVEDDKTKEKRPAEPLSLGLTVASRFSGSGRVEGPEGDVLATFRVRPGETEHIAIDTSFQVRSSQENDRRGLHVIADVPISLYGTNHRYQTTDTYLAFPVDALGTSYRAVGYKWLSNDLLSQFAIVGTEMGTEVTITPSVVTREGNPAGRPFTVMLNRGDVFQVFPEFDPSSSCDLTGTLVTSDKSIALFSGHNCAYVPDRAWKACNILAEQLLPTDTWGSTFVVGPFDGRTSAVVRVVAHLDGTVVSENGFVVAKINAGEFYENQYLVEPEVITASNPVMVMQFSKGFTAPEKTAASVDSVGDPMMILIPPVSQYLNTYSLATPFDGSWEHYANLVVNKKHAESLLLDGMPVTVGKFTPIGKSEYLFAQIPLKEGTHIFDGKGPFGLYSYGFGFEEKVFDAYGNSCGQGVRRNGVAIGTEGDRLSSNADKSSAESADGKVAPKDIHSVDTAVGEPPVKREGKRGVGIEYRR